MKKSKSPKPNDFFSIYSQGFIRAAVIVPHVKIAAPDFNAQRIVRSAVQANKTGAAIAVFPELCLSAYSCDDLFHQKVLQQRCMELLPDIADSVKNLNTVLIIGSPVVADGLLFNCAVIIYEGRILGIVPKTYIPNYREFYEKRHFTSANEASHKELKIGNSDIPFGNDLIFGAANLAGFSFGVEICEDLWSPLPPSTFYALAGATISANLSASNITMGKSEYRSLLARSHSGKCLSAYLYSAAGEWESTTDLAWDGHGMICENGRILAQTERFAQDESMIIADIDIEKLLQERLRVTSFNDTAAIWKNKTESLRKISFSFTLPEKISELCEKPERYPYVPADVLEKDKRCREAYRIQVQGLASRLQSCNIRKVVIGISGGLDSTQALIVAAKTMDRLSLPRTNILGYSMPGLATGRKTRTNAKRLMNALGVSAFEIDIRASCMQMFRDIGHPYAEGEALYDTTFENVQAGERTSHLFRLANMHKAIVLGTGDLSELALGWCTYGVGDHMSHYNVNASIPKTLIRHLIRWTAETEEFGTNASRILHSVLNTKISPELLPGSDRDGQPLQSTQDTIGPFDLQDFFLYYATRFGFKPSRLAFLCHQAWGNVESGKWPEAIPTSERRSYDLQKIKKWLRVFVTRFFGNTQFKRSCVPNGPKVGSGGSLSPRGDWRAPSEGNPELWLHDLENNIPDQ